MTPLLHIRPVASSQAAAATGVIVAYPREGHETFFMQLEWRLQRCGIARRNAPQPSTSLPPPLPRADAAGMNVSGRSAKSVIKRQFEQSENSDRPRKHEPQRGAIVLVGSSGVGAHVYICAEQQFAKK